MSAATLSFSTKARRTPESPISYFMEKAIGNPNLISLAAGLVDSESLPAGPVARAMAEILNDPKAAKAALQYGTTRGYLPLLEKIAGHIATLDGTTAQAMGISARDVMVTTGSQQLLYMLSELLLDPEDIVIVESPSYFVFHSVLAGTGVRVVSVPMDDDGMKTGELEATLTRLDAAGELHRVKLIYTVDYFQNPTGRTLSVERRRDFMRIVHAFAAKQRILVLEDAAYRELRYEGPELPSLKSLDAGNRHVIYAGTFSKPLSPGMKTGYAIVPNDLVDHLIRLKGNHDFGSNNLSQYVIHHLIANGEYAKHVETLKNVYREKRDTMLNALQAEFADMPEVHWTKPRGGMFVWLTMPTAIPTTPGGAFIENSIREGVLFIPGEFGHVDDRGPVPKTEARISFGDAKIPQILEGIKRLRKAAGAAAP
jgi:2-aminoadipate transaminase